MAEREKVNGIFNMVGSGTFFFFSIACYFFKSQSTKRQDLPRKVGLCCLVKLPVLLIISIL